jgi:hypothetical protein
VPKSQRLLQEKHRRLQTRHAQEEMQQEIKFQRDPQSSHDVWVIGRPGLVECRRTRDAVRTLLTAKITRYNHDGGKRAQAVTESCVMGWRARAHCRARELS